MITEVKIPAVGESITSGVVSTWHRKDGDIVRSGDVLLTLETDKVSTEIVAEKGGLLQIKVAEGTEVNIGAVVATIDDSAAETAPAASAPKTEKPAAMATKEIPTSVPAASVKPAPVTTATPQLEAEEVGQLVSKSTLEGKIVRKKLSPLRRKIAAQLVTAQHTAAILTTFNECDMGPVQELRARMQEAFTKQHGVKLGFMSFFVKAVVKALKDVPAINGRIEGDDFIQNLYYDIGVAVGTERGLVVPVVRDADKKSFAEIERELAAYAVKAREGKIKIEDLQGGVFTISNGGVYGSLLSTPIINPPQSGILGMHKIQDRAVVVDKQIVVRPMMYVALSYDHRVVDGKEAVTFLIKVKEAIEDPVRLMLEL